MNQNKLQNTMNLPQTVSNTLETELVIDNKELIKLTKDVHQLLLVSTQLQNLQQSEIQKRHELEQ
ncbi:hypothetical protein [Sulfurimonas sp.]|uniref:hypothetical protein n=1 Tax=Sulfurimonas sp. TaxID=2022749 RepID=UPI0025D4D65F|nr:hypothetical protein [Sulfurimonas sp.]